MATQATHQMSSERILRTKQLEIVGELSANHNGSLARALELVSAASKTGVDAIKLQTYTPDTITLASDLEAFKVSKNHELWGGRSLYDLYLEAHTPWEWHEPIFSLAQSLGLEVFSSPFDETAVDFLESLGVKRYKIASLEIVDLPLIAKVAATGKPIILSTGASTLQEVGLAVNTAREVNPLIDITLLLCTSSYPASPNSIGLSNMKILGRKFDAAVGFSDHTIGIGVSVAAAALGASMIEKHITLDESSNGPDASFSASVTELALLVKSAHEAAAAVKEREFGPHRSEHESLRLRPSLWVTANVKKGDLVSEHNVRSLRPSGGLPPSELKKLIGQTFSRDVSRATPMSHQLHS
jgi:N-acetylneuraminate synthase